MATNTELKKKIQRVERILRADIRWLLTTKDARVKNQPRWNPQNGAWLDPRSRQFVPEDECGACAIGAHVIRGTQKKLRGALPGANDEVAFAARSLKLRSSQVYDIYWAVWDAATGVPECYPEPFQALGYRLNAYADKLIKEMHEKEAKCRTSRRSPKSKKKHSSI